MSELVQELDFVTGRDWTLTCNNALKLLSLLYKEKKCRIHWSVWYITQKLKATELKENHHLHIYSIWTFTSYIPELYRNPQNFYKLENRSNRISIPKLPPKTTHTSDYPQKNVILTRAFMLYTDKSFLGIFSP